MTFKALLLSQDTTGEKPVVTAEITELDDIALPQVENSVDIAVEYSSLNYKDGMVLRGIGRLVRTYPHIPGVDLAGTVIDSADDRYRPGDNVLCTGWRVGEMHWGGYAERARLNADWLVSVPEGMSTKDVMAIGTAGFTAMQAIDALETNGLNRINRSSSLVHLAVSGRRRSCGAQPSDITLWPVPVGWKTPLTCGRWGHPT